MKIISISPELWEQDPVSTEQHCYRLLMDHPLDGAIAYYAIPWAPMINQRLKLNTSRVERFSGPSFTICQHIHYAVVASYCQRLGINTLFTPHSTTVSEHPEVLIAGVPHLPCVKAEPAVNKDVLFSFMGASNTHWTRSRLRELKGGHIVLRDTWHFWEQDQATKQQQYADLLSRSLFSLCPRGTGPGTIRFWESLQAGAIPVLISDELVLPEGVDWDSCVVRVPETENAIDKIPSLLRGFSETTVRAMQESAKLACAILLEGKQFLSPIELWANRQMR